MQKSFTSWQRDADLSLVVQRYKWADILGLKRVYADAGQTDRLDAFFIAERLRVGRLPQPFQPDLVYAPRPRLTRFRAHLAQTLAREKNYCLALLFLPFSAFRKASPLR